MDKIKKKKRFGQNFLSDRFILSNLFDYIKPSSEDSFIEIGPGIGDLTEMFSGIPKKYIAVEIDEDLIGLLKEKFKKDRTFTIINENILDIELQDFVKSNKKIRLIGNLPYNLSSPILDWCFKNIHLIEDMHFMFQKEFAERCAGSGGSKSFGKLSVICHYFCDVNILSNIDRSFFDPAPKVDSCFVRFKPNKTKINFKELKNINFLLNKLFNKKRKKIRKTLEELFFKEDLLKLNIDLNHRPDQLAQKDFIALARLRFKNG